MGAPTEDDIRRAEEKYNRLIGQLEQLERDYAENDAALNDPNNRSFRDSREGRRIQREQREIADAIQLVRAKIDRLAEMRNGVAIVHFHDDDTVTPDEDFQERMGDAKPFTDASFEGAFAASVQRWANQSRTSLNTAHSYMIKMDSPQGLGKDDVWTVVEMAIKSEPKAAAALATVKTIVGLIEKAYASGRSAASVNDIHQKMDAAFTRAAEADHKDAFKEFIEEYKKQKGIDKSVTDVWSGLFMPACTNFATNHLPRTNKVAKAFLKACVDATEDATFEFNDLSWDGSGKAGFAYVEMLELAGTYHRYSGTLDDVPEQLLEAVRQIWKNELVIDLPFMVRFSIRNVNWAETAVIERQTPKAGNTDFKLISGTSGKDRIFETFKSERAYLRPRVNKLVVD